jgi:hypothetical protein
MIGPPSEKTVCAIFSEIKEKGKGERKKGG